MEFIRISEYIGLVAFILWAVMERGFSLLNLQQREGRKQEEGSYWLISLFWYGATIFSLLDAWSFGWTTFGAPLRLLRGSGMLLALCGIAIRFLARRDLGREYSVHVKTYDAHKLVTTGIYTMVRHPAYLGLLLLFMGIPLSEGSWGGTIVAAAGGIPAILYRIRIEEKLLSEWFGEPYRKYIERSWRLFPYVW